MEGQTSGQIDKLKYICFVKHRDKQTEGQSDNQTNILLPIFHFKREAKLIFKSPITYIRNSIFILSVKISQTNEPNKFSVLEKFLGWF